MSFVVAPIVEGHGDVAAVPVLIRKMARSFRRFRKVIDEFVAELPP